MSPPHAAVALALAALAALAPAARAHDHATAVLPSSWTAVAPMPSRRSDMTATAVGATVYVVGGCADDQVACDWWDGCSYCPSVTDELLVYDADADRWTAGARAPRARYRHAAAHAAGLLYVIGGRDVDDNLVAEVDVLDTATGAWTTLAAPWGDARSDLGAFVAPGGATVYAVGGYNADYSVAADYADALDIATGAWALRRDGAATIAPMREGRGDFAVVDGGDGRRFYACVARARETRARGARRDIVARARERSRAA